MTGVRRGGLGGLNCWLVEAGCMFHLQWSSLVWWRTPSTTELGRQRQWISMSSRLAWFPQWVPGQTGLHSETLCQKKKNQQTNYLTDNDEVSTKVGHGQMCVEGSTLLLPLSFWIRISLCSVAQAILELCNPSWSQTHSKSSCLNPLEQEGINILAWLSK